MQIFLLIVFGIISGLLGGMGMGGGTALIPLLTIILGFNQKLSQGYNLISFLIMSVIALVIHSKNKLVEWKIVFPIAISGAVCSVVGSLIANSINSKVLKILFGSFLIAISIYQLVVAIICIVKQHKKQ